MTAGRIRAAAANLFPGYFAIVMATGIISIAAFQRDMERVAWVLILGVWRHIRKHFPLAYDPLYWGMAKQ